MLLRGTFGSLHVLFVCVHSIFVFTTYQCPIYGVKCAGAPYQRSRGESDCNGSRRRCFTMSRICAEGIACLSRRLVIFKRKLYCCTGGSTVWDDPATVHWIYPRIILEGNSGRVNLNDLPSSCMVTPTMLGNSD